MPPSGFHEHLQELILACTSGEVRSETIDRSLHRVLALYEKVSGNARLPVDHRAHHALAIRAAEDGIILLQNKEHLLSLRQGTQIAVIGAIAEEGSYVGTGSGHTNARDPEYPLEQLEYVNGKEKVLYAPGYRTESVKDSPENTAEAERLFSEAVRTAARAEGCPALCGEQLWHGGRGF